MKPFELLRRERAKFVLWKNQPAATEHAVVS
jgi:hypothetical protein